MLNKQLFLLSLLASNVFGFQRRDKDKLSRSHATNLHLSRQPGLNPRPAHLGEIAHGTGPIRRRQDTSPYNATSFCDPSSPASSFAALQCTGADDCRDWLQYHGKISLYTAPNVHSEALYSSYSNLAGCGKHQCAFSQPLKEGESCDYTMDTCAYPNSCSSGICQPPLAGGCGSCTEDISACVRGTLCSSTKNACVEYLTEGEQCVYKVVGTFTEGDSTYTTYTTEIYPCGVSQTEFGTVVVPNLQCDFVSQKCVKGPKPVAAEGGECSLDQTQESANGGCDAGLFCKSTSQSLGVCTKLSQEGESCKDLHRCADNLLCDTTDSTCKKLGSVDHGGSCGDDEASDELCKIGLYCVQGQCQAAAGVGETCSNGQRCVYGTVCDGEVCVAGFSVGEGGKCQQSYSFISACDTNLECIEGTCQRPATSECAASGMCFSQNFRLGSCQCGDSGEEDVTTCQPLNPDDSRSFKSIAKCLAMSTSSPYSADAWKTNPKFHAFACCAVCSGEQNLLKSLFFNQQIDRLLYGLDGKQLNCQNIGSGEPLLVERSSDWCQYGADYSLSGSQALAKCPGAPEYKGLPPRQRNSTAPSSAADYAICAIEKCSSHGQCTSIQPAKCQCDPNFAGDQCQYDVSRRAIEQKVLKTFFFNTAGNGWVDIQGWTQDNHCRAKGVTCNEHGLVTALRLPYNNLKGVAPALDQLIYLRYLDLQGNFLSGEPPKVADSVVEIDLSRNFLNGTLPDYLFSLPALRKFKANGNRFSGGIPYNIGWSTSHLIDLSRNNLTGTLPLSLGAAKNIITIDFTNNHLDTTENLPTNICNSCPRYVNVCGQYRCPNCNDGQLLSCHSPSAILEKEGIISGDGDVPPDQCGYSFP